MKMKDIPSTLFQQDTAVAHKSQESMEILCQSLRTAFVNDLFVGMTLISQIFFFGGGGGIYSKISFISTYWRRLPSWNKSLRVSYN